MSTKGDKRTFKNEDLILKVTENIDPKKWDEGKYEAFLDELCGHRDYQKEAICTTLRFLLGGKYANLRVLAEEHFRVLYLNRRNALLEDSLIAHGSVDSVRPSLRTIVARALQVNASALIAAHNHPSGAAEPSESDRMLTQDLIAASRPLGLKVLDYVIVGEETTFSFADNGLLGELELLCLAPGESVRHSKLTKYA